MITILKLFDLLNYQPKLIVIFLSFLILVENSSTEITTLGVRACMVIVGGARITVCNLATSCTLTTGLTLQLCHT